MALPLKNQLMLRKAIKQMLLALGENPDRQGLRGTPKRVTDMYSDVLDGIYAQQPIVSFFEQENYGSMVMVHHAPFYAFCEHHLAVFLGHFGIAYVPDRRIVGLSKLVRIFRYGCKRITIQERITNECSDKLMHLIKPKGVIVYVNAEHTCMSLRGVKSPGSRTTTMAYRGIFATNPELRQQFLDEASK